MSRLARPDQNTLDQCEAALSQAQATMGYLPNDVLSLCHWPELLPSLSGLVQTILQSGQVDPMLKRLIGVISSHTQGCTYCTGAVEWRPRDKKSERTQCCTYCTGSLE